jgi:hypothetical protein
MGAIWTMNCMVLVMKCLKDVDLMRGPGKKRWFLGREVKFEDLKTWIVVQGF